MLVVVGLGNVEPSDNTPKRLGECECEHECTRHKGRVALDILQVYRHIVHVLLNVSLVISATRLVWLTPKYTMPSKKDKPMTTVGVHILKRRTATDG